MSKNGLPHVCAAARLRICAGQPTLRDRMSSTKISPASTIQRSSVPRSIAVTSGMI